VNPYPPPPPWAAAIPSVGVTGTNGKTSTVHFVSAALGCTGDALTRVSTVDAALGVGEALELRPPPSQHSEFLGLMAELRELDAPCHRAAIEATSATLALGFAQAWPFDVAVFTNLGHDHQKTHPSFEHYLAAKAQLFVSLRPGGAAILNAGDPQSSLIAEVLGPGVRALWYAGPGAALDRAVDLRVVEATPTAKGLALDLDLREGLGSIPATIELRALAPFQAANAAAALLAALALDLPGERAAAAIARCPPPPGRFEPISVDAEPPAPPSPAVIVDYAHTPEALAAALASARARCAGELWLIVGAGGDADPSKRAPLGAQARRADRVVLTNDNPRHEDPAAIAAQIHEGLGDHGAVEHVLDRAAAIERAIARARPEDLVLIAGKGHEREQDIAGQRRPLDDRALARAALARAGRRNTGGSHVEPQENHDGQ